MNRLPCNSHSFNTKGGQTALMQGRAFCHAIGIVLPGVGKLLNIKMNRLPCNSGSSTTSGGQTA